jgi:hypothetical protein
MHGIIEIKRLEREALLDYIHKLGTLLLKEPITEHEFMDNREVERRIKAAKNEL